MRVTIFGSGYVGLVTGACLAETGNHVLCVDIDAGKIERLKRGRDSDLRARSRGARQARRATPAGCEFTTDVAAGVAHGLFQFIARRHAAGRGRLRRSAARARRRALDRRALDRLPDRRRQVDGAGRHGRSASRPRFRATLDKRGGAIEFDVVSNPEFLKEGAAVEDFMKPDRIIVGTDNPRTAELLRTLYEPSIATTTA